MTGVRLRPLTAADIHLIAGVVISAEQAAFLSTPDVQAFLADAAAHPTFTPYAAMAGNHVAGFVSAGTIPERPDDWWVPLLIIAGDHQGRGIGRAVMESVIELAKERGGVRLGLSVHRQNTVALHLYQSLGFEFKPENAEVEVAGWLPLGGISPMP